MPNKKWFKGSLHTHTSASSHGPGDTSPQHVSEWYHEHDYDFLVLSDHNHRTILEGSDTDREKWPHLIPGEEITSALCRGDRVELRGFGAFSVKQRGSRVGRNPRTGEAVQVVAKSVPYFKTGKNLRAKLNN